jgi:hypothetical protein
MGNVPVHNGEVKGPEHAQILGPKSNRHVAAWLLGETQLEDAACLHPVSVGELAVFARAKLTDRHRSEEGGYASSLVSTLLRAVGPLPINPTT